MRVRRWWSTWGDLTSKLIALGASYASLGGLLMAFLPQRDKIPPWAIGLLLCGGLSFIVLVCLEFFNRRRIRAFNKDDVGGIRRYMHNWIEHGGVAAIWSRDMTWAQNAESRKLLKEKAKRKELILCLPEENPLATELERAGAEVCVYGTDLLESPASRFTITFFGKSGARVAVGRPDDEIHVIEEFAEGDHPAFALALDLVTIARSIGHDRRMNE